MYNYQFDGRYFAQAPGKMEAMCADELRELGATDVEAAYRGVYFSADKATLYRINYMSRMLSRVLAPLISIRCRDTEELTATSRKIAWETFFTVDQTFAITASVTKSSINNSLYAAQCLKDGIVDHFRDVSRGVRPSVETVNPDVRLNLHIEEDRAVISLDTSGESLHKRGYRLLAGEAPMQETLAAAIIRQTGWDGETPLWDCMCGSGTLLCEALMHYCRMPAQLLRRNFGFFYLPDFEEKTWKNVKAECDAQMRPLPRGLISGSDISPAAVSVAKENLSRLPYSEAVTLKRQAFQRVKEFENGTLLANPPYGIRMGELEEVKLLYTELGDFIKQHCKGSTAFIYMGDPELRKSIGLKTSRRIPLVNGKLEGVLVRIDSYEGSKKPYYAEYKAQENEEETTKGSDRGE
ncbi:MAG: class I SAM-dependent RNA methyltransferase [Bacteroidetes bacterium]|nr:class I SAM-dependent RNA methyltransferase [Bacteroidota bacterium]